MKPCPNCAEQVPDHGDYCPYCKSDLASSVQYEVVWADAMRGGPANRATEASWVMNHYASLGWRVVSTAAALDYDGHGRGIYITFMKGQA